MTTEATKWTMNTCDWGWDGGAPTLTFSPDERTDVVIILLSYENTVAISKVTSTDGGEEVDVMDYDLSVTLKVWNAGNVAHAARSLALGLDLPDPTIEAVALFAAAVLRKTA